MGTPLAVSANYPLTALQPPQSRTDFAFDDMRKIPVVSGIDYSSMSGMTVDPGVGGAGGGRRRTSSSSGPPLDDQGEVW